MGFFMVGGYPESKKSDQTLWFPVSSFRNSIYYHSFHAPRMNKLIILVAVLILTNCAKTEKQVAEPKKELQTPSTSNIQSEIPDLWISLEDGRRQSASTLKGKIVIFLFQPDCDHCQREAADIARHISHFKDYQLYFVSSAPLKEVLKSFPNH